MRGRFFGVCYISPMSVYRKRASALNDRLRQATLPLLTYSGAFLSIIAFLNWDQITGRRGASRFAVPVAEICSFAIALFLVLEFAKRQVRKINRSFEIEIGGHEVTRRLEGVPDIAASFNQIQYLHFTRQGSIILETIEKDNRIVVPFDVEQLDQCLAELVAHGIQERPHWKRPVWVIRLIDGVFMVANLAMWLTADRALVTVSVGAVLLYIAYIVSRARFVDKDRYTRAARYFQWVAFLLSATLAVVRLLSVWRLG
jgi:hypothetical protein